MSGIADPYGDALGQAIRWLISVVFVYWAFLFAGALGFRLLVPTFAGAPPRAVAVVVTAWPIALGAQLIGQDLLPTLFFAAVGVVWGLTMPLPKRTVFSDGPIRGGAIVGLAFGAIGAVIGVEWAILWCAIRLFRRKSLEAAATAICAAIMPALFLATQLPHASLSANAIYVIVEVMILGVLALIGFIRWLWQSEDEPEGGAPEMVAATDS